MRAFLDIDIVSAAKPDEAKEDEEEEYVDPYAPKETPSTSEPVVDPNRAGRLVLELYADAVRPGRPHAQAVSPSRGVAQTNTCGACARARVGGRAGAQALQMGRAGCIPTPPMCC